MLGLIAVLICLFLPAHNAGAQLPNVAVTVSTTAIAQGESSRILLNGQELLPMLPGDFDIITGNILLTPTTIPVSISFSRFLPPTKSSRLFSFVKAGVTPEFTLITYKNSDISNISLDIPEDAENIVPIDENTPFSIMLSSNENITFSHENSRGNPLTLPFTLIHSDTIRLKIRVFLEGALVR